MATEEDSGFRDATLEWRRRLPVLFPAALVFSFLIAPAAGHGATVVTLGFDDGRASQYLARDLLLSHGMKATFYVNSGAIGWRGYLTMAQLHDLENDGHEIGGHTLTHPHLTTLSAAEAQRQICDDRAALIASGFDVTSFAYPYGESNASIEKLAAGCGYTSARIVGGIDCAGCVYAETIPPLDPHATRTPWSVKDDTTVATMQRWVMEAEAHGGGWVNIVLHDICDGCGTYSMSLSALEAFLEWLAPRAAAGTVVKRVRDVMDTVMDTEPPETTIACSPRGCSEWSNGPVTVTLSAVDDSTGVAEVRYTADRTDPGGPTGNSCAANPCSFTVSASTTVTYRARDVAGNVEAAKTQQIRIDTRPPSVAITSPGNLSVVQGTVTVKAYAGDNVRVARVRFFVDGRLIGTSTAAPYQVQWRSQDAGIGLHRLHAEAADPAGNSRRSSPVDVVVGPSLPSL